MKLKQLATVSAQAVRMTTISGPLITPDVFRRVVLGAFDIAKIKWRPEPEMPVKVIDQGLFAVDPAVESPK